MVGSLLDYVSEETLTVRGATWRSFFSAFAEGKDAYEQRGCLEDQAHDLIWSHLPTPFLYEKGEMKPPSLP